MERYGRTKLALFVALIVLTLSVVLAVVSLFPTYTGNTQSRVLVNSTFTLSPNEIYRQGLGSFRGGENISVLIQSPTIFVRNFSILTYNGSHYTVSSSSDIAYTFKAGADYYDAVFTSVSSSAGEIHFQTSVQQPQATFSYSWLNEPAKTLFILSSTAVIVVILKIVFSNFYSFNTSKPALPTVSKKIQRYILLLAAVSLVIWLVILAVNSSPLATFENWYTDNARHSYTATLFLKDSFSVFNAPLGNLANTDNSLFKYVTWPQMPHLYPLGSIILFLPFGVLIQNGVATEIVYKLEIALFLVFANICLYFFLTRYVKKDFGNELRLTNARRREQIMTWVKLGGFYIIYVSLIIYAADGMFDSVAFLFSLFALFMFMEERYDYFFLLVSISIFFKYQAGIFFLPLIIVGLAMLLQKNKPTDLLKNKAVLGGIAFEVVSLFTAWLSAPSLFTIEPQFIMNGINAFSANTQILWISQAIWILLTLAVTIVYALYMLNKNALLSVLAVFLLLPSFMLPYFQNWYLPYIFVYVLIPQRKKELEATMIWLIFMILVLSFGGTAFNPLQIFNGFKTLFHI